MKSLIKFFSCMLLFIAFVFALEPAKAKLEPLPKLRGDEVIPVTGGIPYLGGRQSPGDIIGSTWTEGQTPCSGGGSACQRLMLDSHNQAHIDWTKLDAGFTSRVCAWNARYADGTYYGETMASPSWSGYAQIDVTRDANPDSQRSVVCYHYDAGAGYFSWICIDGGNLWGAFGNPKTPAAVDHIWSVITVASNNNILMATGDYTGSHHHIYLTADEGDNWTNPANFMNSCCNLSYFLRASRNPGSHKVAYVHTQFITDTIAGGQLDQDVYYVLSIDDGVTWGAHINMTNYQPSDTVRAYCDPYAIFDNNDKFHIVWSGRRVDSAGYYMASKIFHWDEVSDTITIVSSPSIYYSDPGGWWITTPTGGHYGAWRMPADKPVLITDPVTDYLYCLWTGNDDYTDTSAVGYINSEIYGAYSTDNGITWSDYVNLTNTRSPGAPAGACYDEDYMTAHLFTLNDSIYTTYIEDKDAGVAANSEGTYTDNPVRCWIFHKNLITGVEEEKSLEPKYTTPKLKIYPNPFSKLTKISFGKGLGAESIELKIYNATGRLVKQFNHSTVSSGTAQTTLVTSFLQGYILFG